MSIREDAQRPDAPIGLMLAVLGRAALSQVTESMRPTGVKPRHIPVLSALNAASLGQQVLGESLGTDPTQLVVFLNELEAAGLVSRRRDPENRRRHIVELSNEGRKKLREAESCIENAENRLLDGVTPADRVRLRRLLAVVMGNIGSAAEVDC